MRTISYDKVAQPERRIDPKPYPTWAEVIERLRRDGAGVQTSSPDTPHSREWHALVADMIVGR